MRGWPYTLSSTQPSGRVITLRPLQRGDETEWRRIRQEDADWLRPWEATVPNNPAGELPFRRLRRVLDRGGRDGRALPFIIDVEGRVVGQMQLFDIVWGSRWTGTAGYWLTRSATGSGIATWSLAMLIDFSLGVYGLHRIEVNIRPENTASLAVAHRLGLDQESLRRDLVHVDGAWRDHLSFAITRPQLPSGGLVGRLTEQT